MSSHETKLINDGMARPVGATGGRPSMVVVICAILFVIGTNRMAVLHFAWRCDAGVAGITCQFHILYAARRRSGDMAGGGDDLAGIVGTVD